MKKTTLTNLMFLTSLALVTSFAVSCQQPSERPAKISEKIADNNFEIRKIQQLEASAEAQKNNQALITKCISLVKDETLKAQLTKLQLEGQLMVKIEQDKLTLITKNKIENSEKSELEKVVELKSQPLKNLASFKILTGTLENELTDYNEKKSILSISERALDDSTHLTVVEQIVEPVATTI